MTRQMQITEDATALIDHASRLLGAIETGNWHYGHDKIHGLRNVLDRLEKQLNPEHRPAELREVDAESVWAAVGRYSSHFWLGRAIFSPPPAAPQTIGAGPMSAEMTTDGIRTVLNDRDPATALTDDERDHMLLYLLGWASNDNESSREVRGALAATVASVMHLRELREARNVGRSEVRS